MSILSASAISRLPDAVRGRVWLPGTPGFDRVHRPWNLAIAQSVAAVVEAVDAADAARLVRFARSHALPVATQPSGHGATGRATDAILLRTSRLDGIDIDPAAMTARIGAGVRSGDLQRAAAAHGLTAWPGSSPVVTVAGAALGGGLSWFGRAFGWIADSIVAADVVTADGVTRRIDTDTDPELLWALRGGGGELAIVTSLTLRLHPAPSVFGGRMLWPATHAHAVAETFRGMADSAPDALTLWLELVHFPGSDPMVAIDATYLGAEGDARALMRPTAALPTPLADTRGMMSVAELGTITGEPTEPAPGLSRAELLTRLDDDVLATLLDEPIAPLLMLQVRHLGGALAAPSDSPHGALTEPYAAYMFGVPGSPGAADEIARKQAGLAAALPVSGRKPITFLGATEQLSDALSAASIERLRALKEARDPQHTIRGNFSVAG